MWRDTGPVTSSRSAWRGLATKLDAQAFDVVVGVVQGVDFQLAAVARTGVDLADGQRLAEDGQQFVWMLRLRAQGVAARGRGSAAMPWRAICLRMCHIRGRAPSS
jgi:hypothetical protein